MQKTLTLFGILFITGWIRAENIQISISGNSYSPAEVTVKVGDQVSIAANSFHPLVQVSKASWMSDGTTPLEGGFGEKTSSYSFTVNSTDTIYYVCTAHVGLGMKGKIIVGQQSTDLIPVQDQETAFSVYPNPVSEGKATIHLQTLKEGSSSIYVTSMDGRWMKVLVDHQFYPAGGHEISFSTDGFVPGLYVLSYVSGKQRGKLLLNIVR